MRKVIWSVVAIVVAVILVSLSGCGEPRELVYDREASVAKAEKVCVARGHKLLRYEINEGKKLKYQLEARCLDLNNTRIYSVFTAPVTE